MRDPESGVSLNSEFQRLPRLIQITGGVVVVSALYHEPFAFADVLTRFKCLREVRRGLPLFSDIAVHEAKIHVSHGEFRIDLGRALIKRNCSYAVAKDDGTFHSKIHGMKGVERGSSLLFQRCVVFLNSRERLAELGPHFGSELPQGIEYVVFVAGLRRSAGDEITASAVNSFEDYVVFRADFRDRTVENGGTGGALADLAADFRSNPRVGRLSHHAQCLLHFFIGNKTEKWRLLKLDREPLT